MKKSILLIVCYLCIASSAFAQSKVEWNPLVFLDDQIYPSFILATAKMTESFGSNPYYEKQGPYYIGSTNSPVGIAIRNPRERSEIKLSIKVDGFAEAQTFTATLSEKGKVYLIFPSVIWNWEKLRSLRQPTPANVTFNLSVDGKAENAQNVVSTARSVNEALLGYYKPLSKQWVDTTFVLTAYANEDHPWIDQILKEALDTGLVDAFDGYQSREGVQVLKQVGAIWTVLQKRGFKYSSITKTSNASQTVFTQTVRLFDESINASQSNCIDGTALFAAILTKIGIESSIVTIPGHAFLAFRVVPGDPLVGLETTMMGSVDLRGQTSENAYKASARSFIDAISSGTKTLRDNDAGFAAFKPMYSIMKLEHARKIFSIAPIASNLDTRDGQMKAPPPIDGGMLNGKATSLPLPPYPPAARAVRAAGQVKVEVIVDENGNVISASAFSGHLLLRSAAVEAARSAKFSPSFVDGVRVRVKGVIIYTFTP